VNSIRPSSGASFTPFFTPVSREFFCGFLRATDLPRNPLSRTSDSGFFSHFSSVPLLPLRLIFGVVNPPFDVQKISVLRPMLFHLQPLVLQGDQCSPSILSVRSPLFRLWAALALPRHLFFILHECPPRQSVASTVVLLLSLPHFSQVRDYTSPPIRDSLSSA